MLFTSILALFTVFAYSDKMLSLLAICLFLALEYALKHFLKVKGEVRVIYYLLLFFIFYECVTGLDDSHNFLKGNVVYIEKYGLIAILGISILKNKMQAAGEYRTLTILAISFVMLNFLSTMINYGSFRIFIDTSFEYCKYFLLIYLVMISKLTDKDLLKLLYIYSLVVIVSTFLAVFQFMGIPQFFTPFLGGYDIQFRSGLYRSIGFFPYPIEFGNYSCVLFSIYYFLNRYKFKKKWLSFISLCLLLNVALSGTRIAVIAVVVVLILSSMKSYWQAVRTTVILVIMSLILNQFFNLQEVISDTKMDYSGVSPREYFITEGIQVWEDHPIIGIGFNTFGTEKYRKLTGDRIFNQYNIHYFDWANLTTTDTFFAQLLPEFGIAGLMLIFFFALFIFRRYRKLDKTDRSNRAYIYAVVSCIVLSSNSSSVLFNPHVGAFLWLSLGLLLSNSIRKEQAKAIV